jgi:hypothetical protein
MDWAFFIDYLFRQRTADLGSASVLTISGFMYVLHFEPLVHVQGGRG